jgi:hypothetical protein
MRKESLPAVQDLYRSLETAAVDIYGFGVICHEGASWLAEPEILDTLLLGMENFWFTDEGAGVVSHKEFREDFFRTLWKKSQEKRISIHSGSDVPMGHEEMAFYELPLFSRAALYLRTKKQFSFPLIASILGSESGAVEEEIERAREFLLGRRIKPLAATEDF